jgi:hypothetical protein
MNNKTLNQLKHHLTAQPKQFLRLTDLNFQRNAIETAKEDENRDNKGGRKANMGTILAGEGFHSICVVLG